MTAGTRDARDAIVSADSAAEDAPCHRRIGVHGDRSCPELATYVHCVRCPVFEASARDLFDRPPPQGYRDAWTRVLVAPPEPVAARGESFLVLRAGREWLALPTRVCVEVAPYTGAHPLAHRRSAVFEGIVNVRGQLLLACALRTALGVADAPSAKQGALLLVAELEGSRWGLVIDEVAIVRRITDRERREVPATLASAVAHHVHAIVEEGEVKIGLLDPARLAHTLTRSVA